MAGIPRLGSVTNQSQESSAPQTIYSIEVLVDHDICADLRRSDSAGLRQITDLLDCNNPDFPFTDTDLQTLKNLKSKVSLIAKEFYLNYGRFFLGAACGFVAVLLYYSSPKATPLLSGFGAGLSGSFGLCVTKIRGINLESIQKSHFVESLRNRHLFPASALIKLAHANPSLAKQIAERIHYKVLIAFRHPEIHGLNSDELGKICSPLTQVSSFILERAPLQDTLLSLVEEVSQQLHLTPSPSER